MPYHAPHRRGRTARGTLLGVILAALGGCGDNSAATPPVDEGWYLVSMGGMRAGYTHSRVEQKSEEGRTVLHVQQELRQNVARFGEPFDLAITLKSVESLDGRLMRFETQGQVGSQPLELSGRVAEGQLRMRTTVAGKTTDSQLPWSDDIGGFLAVEQSLERQPLQPGEKRSLRKLELALFQVVVLEVQLTAKDYEPVELRGDSVELLRIDASMSLSGQAAIPHTMWTDRQGRTVKSFTPSLRQEVVKCAKTEAQKPIDGPRYDMGTATAVPIQGATKGLTDARRVRYRIRLKGSDPVKVFSQGPAQRIRSLDGRTAEMIVQALRPDTPGVSDDSRPSQDDLAPNSWIQSDHPKVLALAKQVAPQEPDRWKLAVALERHVKTSMRRVDFASAMLTAAEVAESLEGDCTEHAMLLAALARARGIPARVVLGLVQSGQSFAFHMWTEVYIVDRWIALDATRAQGGISAAYLKLIDTNLAGQDGPLTGLFRVIEVVGQFEKLEVLDVE